MKKRLLKLLKAKQERKQGLAAKAKTTDSVEELRSINTELETLNAEIAELRSMIDELPDEDPEGEPQDPQQRNQEPAQEPQQRSQPIGTAKVLGTYGINQAQQPNQRSGDRFDTPEYRGAFMNYVTRGERSEDLEFRADATTMTTDIGAVIPTTIMNKIIEKMNDYGMIWPRVTKTNFRGGLDIPYADLKPVATWQSEGTVAAKQKKAITGAVNFKYHKLQCRVAVSLEADTVSLPVFEQNITDNIYEAMIIALEEGIINGTGTGQPLGITKDTKIPSEQIVEVAVEDMDKYQTWTTLIAKVPRKYRNRAVIILNDMDWNKYILGMTDTGGQPIARVTYGIDGTQQERLLGKEVIPVEDHLASIDDAQTGDVFGVICNLNDYIVNSNMQMTYKRYFDEDTDEWVSKSTLIADGKLGDKNGVVLLKKKATV